MIEVFADTFYWLAVINPSDELYGGRSDTDWSLTDCVSFVIMRDRGIVTALTADRHFEQAGFGRLFG